jgi:cytochrome b
VATFFIAYLTEDDLLLIHVWAGYIMLAAIAIRFLWGFAGTYHARFKNFITRPADAWQYVKEVFKLRAARYLGHNPAGGLMIVALLVGTCLTGLTGMLLYGAEDQAGPFATWFSEDSHFWEEVLEGMHEFFANACLLLVVVHVAGVLFESALHNENLVRSMWTGYKKSEE